MADGLSEATADAILSAIFQATAYSETALWAQLHTGAPGAAGTANVATETTRIDVSACFGSAPSGGSIVNDSALGPWTSVTGSETYTHITLWTLVTGGGFICSGVITAAPVTAGDDFTIPAGDVTATMPVAA